MRRAIVLLFAGAVAITSAACDETTALSSTSSAVAPPTSTKSSMEPLPESVDVAGRYAFGTTFDAGPDPELEVSMVVPAGYGGVFGVGALKLGTEQTGAVSLAVGDVYAESCDWAGTELDSSSISSADGVAAALVSQGGLRVSAPTDVTVDGYPATYIERRVPAGTRLSDCDEGQFRVYTDRLGGARWLNPGQVDRLWIVDVDGVPLVIDASLESGTSAKVRAEVLKMAESVQIEPHDG